MEPTVYLPRTDVGPTGVRPASTCAVARFSVGRITTPRPWVRTQGRQVGKHEQRTQTVAGNSEERRIA